MDQKHIENGGVFTGAMLCFIGLMLLPVAVGMIWSYPDKIWLLGLVSLLSSLVLLVSGVRGLRSSSKKLQTLTKELEAIKNDAITNAQKVDNPIDGQHSDSVVLASWNYTAEEWQKFMSWQVNERKWSHITTSIVLALLSILLLRFGRESSWGLALIIGGVFAICFGFLSYYLSISSVGRTRGKINQVYITANTVVLNDKMNPIADSNRWVGELKIIEEAEPKVLSITSYWKTRKGNSNEEIFVPIPKGKLGEGVMLMDKLRRLHPLQ
ncbi:MAG: hypothetical protein H7Y31_06840 [Chitinophagaceae bacterium]|nr:hypothetical protein [Chitinophagaceae bacterium]